MNIKALHDRDALLAAASKPDDALDSTPVRARWSRGRWLALLAIAGLLGLVVAYRLWVRAAENRLAAAIAELRQAGEPVTYDQLTRPPVPPVDDAAFHLRAASALIDVNTDAWRIYRRTGFDEVLSDEAKQSIAGVLAPETSRQALVRIREARSKKSADWQLQMKTPLVSMLLPELNAQHGVSNLCCAAAQDARLRKDYGAVTEYARDMLGVSRALSAHPTLVGYMVSNGGVGMTASIVEMALPEFHIVGGTIGVGGTKEAQGQPAAPEQVKALIADLLDDSVQRRSFLDAIRDERVLELDTVQAVVDRRMDVNAVAGTTGNAAMGIGGLPLVPKPLMLNDAVLMLKYSTGVLKAVEKSPDLQTFRATVPPLPIVPGPRGSGGNVMARLLLPPFDRTVEQHFQALTERRLAATALAIKWYQADHGGAPPRTLEELVPKYLPAVPRDPMAAGDQPLRYLLEGERIAVYGVAENGLDEGGSERPMNKARPSTHRWSTRDAVFWISGKPARMPEPKE